MVEHDPTAFLIEWNNTFPLDRWYRKKHGILFNSNAHKAISQIDIYLEWLEDNLFEKHENDLKEAQIKREKYNKGEWISPPSIPGEKADELFDKINF